MSETKFDGNTAFVHMDRYKELLESEGQLLKIRKVGAKTPTATRVEAGFISEESDSVTKKNIPIKEILNEREKTHGKFEDHAAITYAIKYTMRNAVNWPYLRATQKEALDMIAHKIGRILAGNQDIKDHWDDIAGYATLISREIK